jgi:endonuclease YncB( thermonuclease family)
MPVGMLQVQGTIDVAQFWPSGTSDADTTKVVVTAAEDAFEFRPADGMPFRPTRFYAGAKVRGRGGTRPLVDAKGRIVIRLQGIDAPELHYRPAPLSPQEKSEAAAAVQDRFRALDRSYRQPLGATTTGALADFLQGYGAAVLPCRVWTRVDRPDEVFDTYGRLVGDIELDVARSAVNLNRWLAENGLAFPTFYSSMTDEEIGTLTQLAATARRARRGVWKRTTRAIPAFDFDLLEPAKGDVSVLDADAGPVLMPKLYRRQCSYAVRRRAGVTRASFQRYLEAGQDFCFRTDDFLRNGVHSAVPHTLASFVEAGRTVRFSPEALVFKEAASSLIGPGGKPVLRF